MENLFGKTFIENRDYRNALCGGKGLCPVCMFALLFIHFSLHMHIATRTRILYQMISHVNDALTNAILEKEIERSYASKFHRNVFEQNRSNYQI